MQQQSKKDAEEKLTRLLRVDAPETVRLEQYVAALQYESIRTAASKTKAGLTRMRNILSKIQKSALAARKELLEMRHAGQIKTTELNARFLNDE